MINSYSFGAMTIDGHPYTSDLIIFPDGRVQDAWWRKRGHVLTAEDIGGLVDSNPKIVIAGTGVNGLMKPEGGLSAYLSGRGIDFMAGPNETAVKWFNELSVSGGVGACFHSSC